MTTSSEVIAGEASSPSEGDHVTPLLAAWSRGEQAALERLMPLVIEDLQGIARRCFEKESGPHILQPMALVNELYLRLAGYRGVNWKNRHQFFAYAAQVMRRILVDHSRIQRAGKRGEGHRPVPLEDLQELGGPVEEFNSLDLNRALARLATKFPRAARVVKLRVFGGFTCGECAEILGTTDRTVKRDWRVACHWLRSVMHP